MGENDSCLWRGEYARAIVRKREREIVYNSLGIVCVLSREPLLPLFLGRSLQTAKDATSIVHGGTDIEVKYWHTGLLLGCLVVINDIAAFLAAASDVPVVAVKWKWRAMNNNGKYAVEPGYKIVFFSLTYPHNECQRALGLNSLGRPCNLTRYGSSLHGLTIVVNLDTGVSSLCCFSSYHPRISSHLRTCCHASSFKKLWISTMVSTCSSGVSQPLRRKAL